MVGEEQVVFTFSLHLSNHFFICPFEDLNDFTFWFTVSLPPLQEHHLHCVIMPSPFEVGMVDKDVCGESFDDDVGVLFGHVVYGACVRFRR